MDHKVVISSRDSLDTPIAEMQNEITNLSWQYNRIGGCGSFSFGLPKRIYRDLFLGFDYNVKIFLKVSGTYTLKYQGKILDKTYEQTNNQDILKVSGTGYQTELNHIDVDRDYSSTEVSLIVKSILDNDVTPNTNISYDAGDLTATGFTADSLEFNHKALDAIRTCAEVVGSREWGVDKNRKLYFKERSTSTGYRYPIGKQLRLSNTITSTDIINRVIIIGGEVGGVKFTRVVQDTDNQTKWGRRDKRKENSSIVSNSVADNYGEALLSEFKYVQRSLKLDIFDDTFFEDTIPIPLLQLLANLDTYKTRKYGEGLYCGLISYQINTIRYKIDKSGSVIKSVDVGTYRPDIAEKIGQIEHRLDQMRSVGV
jgi:hypothetical protein